MILTETLSAGPAFDVRVKDVPLHLLVEVKLSNFCLNDQRFLFSDYLTCR